LPAAATEMSEVPMPQAPIICAPMGGGGGQVGGRAGRHLVEPVLLGHHAAHGDLQQRVQLVAALGEALLGVGVLQQAERVAALDDGEDVELAGLAHEVGDGGVPGLVGGHPVALVRGVDRLVGDAELDQHLGLGHVGHRHGRATVGQRDDQRLVHQPLQRGRGVAERHAGDDVDGAVLVEVSACAFLPR
jgi:hypothetical protein